MVLSVWGGGQDVAVTWCCGCSGGQDVSVGGPGHWVGVVWDGGGHAEVHWAVCGGLVTGDNMGGGDSVWGGDSVGALTVGVRGACLVIPHSAHYI